jgi:hypothetical protein
MNLQQWSDLGNILLFKMTFIYFCGIEGATQFLPTTEFAAAEDARSTGYIVLWIV